jgi:hypothetical protein
MDKIAARKKYKVPPSMRREANCKLEYERVKPMARRAKLTREHECMMDKNAMKALHILEQQQHEPQHHLGASQRYP